MSKIVKDVKVKSSDLQAQALAEPQWIDGRFVDVASLQFLLVSFDALLRYRRGFWRFLAVSGSWLAVCSSKEAEGDWQIDFEFRWRDRVTSFFEFEVKRAVPGERAQERI